MSLVFELTKMLSTIFSVMTKFSIFMLEFASNDFKRTWFLVIIVVTFFSSYIMPFFVFFQTPFHCKNFITCYTFILRKIIIIQMDMFFEFVILIEYNRKVLGVTTPEVVMNKISRGKLLCVTTYHKTS